MKTYFPELKNPVPYEGVGSKNPLASTIPTARWPGNAWRIISGSRSAFGIPSKELDPILSVARASKGLGERSRVL
jgi:hypothetical protein